MAVLLGKFTRLLLLVLVSDVLDLLVSFRHQLARWSWWRSPPGLLWPQANELVSATNHESSHHFAFHNKNGHHHYHLLLPAVEARGVAGLGKAGGEGGGGADKAGQQVPSEVYVALTYAGTAFLFTLSVPLILYGLNKVLNRIEDCFGCGPASRRRRRELRKSKAHVEEEDEEEDEDAEEEVVVVEAEEEEKARGKLLSSLEQQLQSQLLQQESRGQYHHHQPPKQQTHSLTSVEAGLANGNISDTAKLSLMSQLQQQLFHLQQQQQLEQQSLAAAPTSCEQQMASLDNGPPNSLQQQQAPNFNPFVLSSPHL